MESLLVLIVIGAIIYYFYNKQENTKKSKTIKPRQRKKIPSKPKPKIDIYEKSIELEENDSKDALKKLKAELRRLRKKAERMEDNDTDGVDDVYQDIEYIETIINNYEVEKIVEKITDLKSYRTFEKKYENQEYGESIGYEEIDRRETVMDEAMDEIGDKPYVYILIADLQLDTPLDVLKKAGKTFSMDETSELEDAYTHCDFNMISFSEIDEIDVYLDEYKEELDEGKIKYLMMFRAIIENTNTDESEKREGVNALISNTNGFKELYFGDASDDDYYDQYLLQIEIQELSKYNIPQVEKFISRGYTTIEEIMEVPVNEILSWKGIGEVTLEKIIYARKNLTEKL